MSTHTAASIQPFIFNVGLVGNGPRGAALNMTAVATALTEFDQFNQLQSLVQPFRIHFHTFERKSWSLRAVGGAFSPSSHGVINTHIPGPDQMIIPNTGSVSPRHLRVIHHVADLRGQLQAYLEDNLSSLTTEYERANVAAAAMLHQAKKCNGSVDGTDPCCTRGTFGHVLQSQFDTVMKEGSQEVPWMQFHFYYDTVVVSSDVTTDPSQPTLTTKDLRNDKTTIRVFDHIIIAEGNIGRDPVQDCLKHRTYLGEANFDSMMSFFGSLGLVGDDNYLRPDARILILGMGQSAVDMATIGAQTTGIATLSKTGPLPFEWDEARMKKYTGVFTNISRGTTYVAPRHTYGTQWPGNTPLPLSRLMVTSALLADNGNALPMLLPILYAAAARELSTVPENNPGRLMTAAELYDEIFSQNEEFFQSKSEDGEGKTWSALLRAGVVYIATGGRTHGNHFDWTSDEPEVFRQMITQYGGWQTYRSMATLHSTDTMSGRCSQPDFFRLWKKEMYPYAGASPACVAHCFASMFQHGITSHLKASFEDLTACPKTGKIICEGKLYDCILGAPVIPIYGGGHLKPLPQHFKENLSNKPAFAKGRLYQTPDSTICGATELGLVGHGVMDYTKKGDTVLKEADWLDTHSFASIVQLSPIVIKYIFCKAALRANHCKDAAASIDSRGRQTWISDADYEKLKDPLSKAYRQLHETAAYVEFCTAFADGDGSRFAEAFDHLGSLATQNAFAACYSDKGYAATYFTRIKCIPEFKMKSREKYYKGWIDYSSHEIHQIWEGICNDICAGKAV